MKIETKFKQKIKNKKQTKEEMNRRNEKNIRA